MREKKLPSSIEEKAWGEWVPGEEEHQIRPNAGVGDGRKCRGGAGRAGGGVGGERGSGVEKELE